MRDARARPPVHRPLHYLAPTRPAPREFNATADLQANLALDLAARLGAASRALPSGYRPAALRLAAVLGLPPGEVLRMEGADVFWSAVSELLAALGGCDDLTTRACSRRPACHPPTAASQPPRSPPLAPRRAPPGHRPALRRAR